jgi:hypothetical protein
LAKNIPVAHEGTEVTIEKGVLFIELWELYIKAFCMAKENMELLRWIG